MPSKYQPDIARIQCKLHNNYQVQTKHDVCFLNKNVLYSSEKTSHMNLKKWTRIKFELELNLS